MKSAFCGNVDGATDDAEAPPLDAAEPADVPLDADALVAAAEVELLVSLLGALPQAARARPAAANPATTLSL